MDIRYVRILLVVMLLIGFMMGLYIGIPKHISVTVGYDESAESMTQKMACGKGCAFSEKFMDATGMFDNCTTECWNKYSIDVNKKVFPLSS